MLSILHDAGILHGSFQNVKDQILTLVYILFKVVSHRQSRASAASGGLLFFDLMQVRMWHWKLPTVPQKISHFSWIYLPQ